MRQIAARLAIITLHGCSVSTPVTAPPEPPAAAMEKPARIPWGDVTGARVGHLASRVHRQLHDPYGGVRETLFVARDVATVAALEGWYRERLGEGWTPKRLSFLPEEHGFAFVAGDRAFAVAWLDPFPDGRVPVLTMRYGEDKR